MDRLADEDINISKSYLARTQCLLVLIAAQSDACSRGSALLVLMLPFLVHSPTPAFKKERLQYFAKESCSPHC